MENEGKIKISLGTAICIFIIVLLLIALVWMYIYFNKDNIVKEGNEVEIQQQEKNETNAESNNDATEAISKISKADAYFVIEKIVKQGDKYEITANILEKEARRFSEEEYNRILEGEKFTFRGAEWKLKEMQGSKGYESSAMLVTSGNDLLYILYDTETKDFYIENVAGVKSGGLADYSNDIINFEVDKDIYVGSFWTSFSNNNGKIKIESANGGESNNLETCTMKELIDWNSDNYNYSGSYEECKATVIDGKVVAIQMFVK